MKHNIFGVAVVVAILSIAMEFYQTTQKLRAVEPSSWTQDQTADCGIVLTGGRGRLHEALDMLYQGQIHKLIVSGVRPQTNLYHLLPMWPYYGKLRERDVILEKRSQTTYGNAQQSLPLVEALQCRDVILMTSALHMTRALKTFRKIFPREVTIHPRSVIHGRLRPSFADAAVETCKLFFYSLWAF